VSAESIARTVQLILAPVVMISSAAVILNGLLTHYGEVNSRIRTMNRERFDILHLLASSGTDTRLVRQRLDEIDHQIPDLLDRHHVIHDAMLALYYAIVILVASMFVVAAAALSEHPVLAGGVLALLLLGTAVMLYAIVLIVREIRRSRRSIVYEAQSTLNLSAPSSGHAGSSAETASS
jgi:small-conductance mechanosensitive channel